MQKKKNQVGVSDTDTEPLSISDVVRLTGYSISTIYKLTSQRQIPHYKAPNGRKLFFLKEEIIKWMTENKKPVIEYKF